jgi:hypothetical protein
MSSCVEHSIRLRRVKRPKVLYHIMVYPVWYALHIYIYNERDLKASDRCVRTRQKVKQLIALQFYFLIVWRKCGGCVPKKDDFEICKNRWWVMIELCSG